MTNRLKQVQHAIIFKNQSAFMSGRLITNNILVAYEILYSMKTRQKGRRRSIAIKLNISKAYDKLE